jgi:hypothetical protein
MTKFIDVVKINLSGCSKCFSAIYILPCRTDKSMPTYFSSFGKPKYRLDATKLLRIDTSDGFHIESKIGSKKIKFVMPKKYEKIPQDQNTRRAEFEKCLAKWLSNTLNVQITR